MRCRCCGLLLHSCLRRMHRGIKGQLSRAVSTRTWPPACGAAADPRVATLSCCHLSNQFWHVPWMLKRTSLCFWQLLEAPGYRSDLIEVTSGASFLTKEVHTRRGTKLAHRALQLLHFCVKHGVTVVWEPMVFKNHVSPCMEIAAKLWTSCLGKLRLLCLRVSSPQIVEIILVCLDRSAAHSLMMRWI